MEINRHEELKEGKKDDRKNWKEIRKGEIKEINKERKDRKMNLRNNDEQMTYERK